MSLDQTTAQDSHSAQLETLACLNRDRFVAELRSGRTPMIEDFLGTDEGPARRVIFRALLVAQRDWSRSRGEIVDRALLCARFRTVYR